MSRKNNDKSQDEEIWSKRFAEDHQELEYVSRSQRSRGAKSNEDGMSPMLAGTVIFLAVIIIGMIFYYLWYSNYLNRPSNEATDPEDDRIETVQNDEETEDPTTEDTNEGSEDQNADSNTETELEPEPQPDPQPQPEPQPEPEPEPEPETEPEPMPEPIKITRMEEAPPVGLPMRQSMIWKENSSRLPVNFGAIREVPVPKGESVHFKNESGAAHFKNEAKGEKVVNQETRLTVVPGDTLWTVTVKANHIEVLSGDGDVHLIFARGGKNIVRINGYIFKMDGDEISLAPDYPGVP